MTSEENVSESGMALSGMDLIISNRFTEIEEIYSSDRGYAVIYRAQRMGKWHVLKGLKAEYADSPIHLGLLQKEFDIGYRLSHQNIVQTIALEKIDGIGTCIILEYIEGKTLRQLITEKRLDAERAKRIISQLCDALTYIHERQIVHRDLKPENIIITTNGDNAKVIDFGFSDGDSYAVLKQPAGTLRYVAPEQSKGEQIDGRADLYALGVIIDEINGTLTHKNYLLRRIASRCTRQNRNERYSSAEAISMLLAKGQSRWRYVAAICLLAIIAFVAYIFNTDANSSFRNKAQTVQRSDTVFLKPEKENVAANAAIDENKPKDMPATASSPAAKPSTNTNIYDDQRLVTLNKFAREKTIEVVKKNERLMADSTLTARQRSDISNNEFFEIERIVRAEVDKHVNKDAPEYPVYMNAILNTMRLAYKDYNMKRYNNAKDE